MTEKLSLETAIKDLHVSNIQAGITTHGDLVVAYIREPKQPPDGNAWVDSEMLGWDEAAQWLKLTAIQLYPDSNFAKEQK